MNIMRKIGDAEKNRMELLEVKDLKWSEIRWKLHQMGLTGRLDTTENISEIEDSNTNCPSCSTEGKKVK